MSQTIQKVQDLGPNGSQFVINNGVAFQDAYYYIGVNTKGIGVNELRDGVITPLRMDDRLFYFVYNLTVYNNKLYFIGEFEPTSSTSLGAELYEYDGSSVKLVADFNPGSESAGIIAFEANEKVFITYNNKLYYTGTNGSSGSELIEFDGTTLRLIDINPGSSNSSPDNFVIYQNKLTFTATSADHGMELWTYDGTNAPTAIDINSGASSAFPGAPIVISNTLYFSAYDSINGNELWSFNGSIANRLSDINPGSLSSNPMNLIEHQGALHFTASGDTPPSLYKVVGSSSQLVSAISDASPGDFVEIAASYNNDLLINLYQGAERSLYSYNSSGMTKIFDEPFWEATLYNGVLYGTSVSPETGYELFKYVNGQIQIAKDFVSGPTGGYGGNLHVYNNQLILHAVINNIPQIVLSDGLTYKQAGVSNTGSGVSVVSIISSHFNPLFSAGDKLLIPTPTSTSTVSIGRYKTLSEDGIIEYALPATIGDTLSIYSFRINFVDHDGFIYYPIRTTTGNRWYLVRFNKVNLSVELIGDGSLNLIQRLTLFNNQIYFEGSNSSFGIELWRYNGSTLERLSDIDPGSDGALGHSELQEYNGKLYFITTNDNIGFELYSYDGATIAKVHNFNWSVQATRNHFNEDMIVYQNKLYLPGFTNTAGEELYEYNGSQVTQSIDLNGIGASGSPSDFHILSGLLYFSSYQGGSDFIPTLYSFDGTTATMLTTSDQILKNILGVYEGKLYVTIETYEYGIELWSYDGTTLALVQDIAPGPDSSTPRDGAFHMNKFYFTANDGINGRELYVLDIDNCPDHVVSHYPENSNITFAAKYNAQVLASAPTIGTNTLTLSAKNNIRIEPGYSVDVGAQLVVDNVGCN